VPESFDTIVIGGGPGGYVAAIRSAQLGRKTAVVERDKAGGRCLNYACIPAKTILRTAEIYTEARESADLGVVASDVKLDWEAVGKRRAAVSESLSGGVKMLWDKNKVTVIEGEGSLTAEGDVKVGEEVYEAGAVVLATGSVALPIPGVEFGGRVVDTWGAWSLPEVPRKIAVVGAGASGSEIASAYGRFGTEVLLIEMLPQILPAEDKDVVRVVERAFKKQNITVATGNPVENVEAGKGSVKLTYGGESTEVDYLCIAGGRAADTAALNLATAGVELEPSGKVRVDEFQRTSNPKVFAIGDLVNRKALPPTRSTRTSSPAPPSATRRSPASASPRRRRRRPATTSRSASSNSAASAAPPSTTTKKAWSRSSPTPGTARSSASTSSATAPAT